MAESSTACMRGTVWVFAWPRFGDERARTLYRRIAGSQGEYVQRLNSAGGGGHYLVTGKYSLGLGVVSLLARYRYSWAGDLVFVEAGAGPAYGFGALDSSISASNGGATKTEIRYHIEMQQLGVSGGA